MALEDALDAVTKSLAHIRHIVRHKSDLGLKVAKLIEVISRRLRDLKGVNCVAENDNVLRAKQFVMNFGVREPIFNVVHVGVILRQLFLFGAPSNNDLVKIEMLSQSFDRHFLPGNVN